MANEAKTEGKAKELTETAAESHFGLDIESLEAVSGGKKITREDALRLFPPIGAGFQDDRNVTGK